METQVDCTPLISLASVGKVFHTDVVETHALSAITVDLQRGEFVAITGPSGCGKSTLLSILGLLDSPDTGRYLLEGVDVTSLGPAQRARTRNAKIGFVFQSFNLIGSMSVEDHVMLPLTYRDGFMREQARARVADVLAQVGMGHRARHYPAQLSGGQQQRVAVARALCGQPAILFADEPTGNLDSHNGNAVMELLQQLHADGTTLCMVTHDPAFARRAGRVLHGVDGRLAGPAASVVVAQAAAHVADALA